MASCIYLSVFLISLIDGFICSACRFLIMAFIYRFRSQLSGQFLTHLSFFCILCNALLVTFSAFYLAISGSISGVGTYFLVALMFLEMFVRIRAVEVLNVVGNKRVKLDKLRRQHSVIVWSKDFKLVVQLTDE